MNAFFPTRGWSITMRSSPEKVDPAEKLVGDVLARGFKSCCKRKHLNLRRRMDLALGGNDYGWDVIISFMRAAVPPLSLSTMNEQSVHTCTAPGRVVESDQSAVPHAVVPISAKGSLERAAHESWWRARSSGKAAMSGQKKSSA